MFPYTILFTSKARGTSIHCKQFENLGISEEGLIKNVTCQEQCISLKNNRVLVTKLFFKEIVFNGPLSYTKYYALRIEFPERDRRHIHLFIWISNAPNIQVKTAFI